MSASKPRLDHTGRSCKKVSTETKERWWRTRIVRLSTNIKSGEKERGFICFIDRWIHEDSQVDSASWLYNCQYESNKLYSSAGLLSSNSRFIVDIRSRVITSTFSNRRSPFTSMTTLEEARAGYAAALIASIGFGESLA